MSKAHYWSLNRVLLPHYGQSYFYDNPGICIAAGTMMQPTVSITTRTTTWASQLWLWPRDYEWTQKQTRKTKNKNKNKHHHVGYNICIVCGEVNKFLFIVNFQNSSPVQDVEVKRFAVTVAIFTAGTFQQIAQGSSTDDDHSVMVTINTWYVYPGVCNLRYFLWRDRNPVLWPEDLPRKSYWQGCRYKWRCDCPMCSWQGFPFLVYTTGGQPSYMYLLYIRVCSVKV